MTEKNTSPNPDSIEKTYEKMTALLRKNRRISPFWLLPFIALCIGAILFFQIIQEQGKSITITFESGEGLVANKTSVRYQGLQIGEVKKVNFTDNMQKVQVVANIYPEAQDVLRTNTKFWLVRPSASLAGISGLDALVSGNYITLQPGDGDREDEFIAEQEGPIAQVNQGDLLIHLTANDLGSISIGASVYLKKIPVGKIYDYRITNDNKVEIDVVIERNYAKFVKKDSRFWNISGIQANISPAGLNLQVDSLNSVVQGAIAFDSPDQSETAQNNANYPLYANLFAAKRGIEVEVNIPNSSGIQAGKTDVYYQDDKIGILAHLSAVENNDEMLKGTLLIDPTMATLLKTNSLIILKDKKPTLGDLVDPQKFLRGDYFEIIPGEGEAKRQFDVIKENELLLKMPNTLVFTLTAPQTYGITEGQGVYYNNIKIGEIVDQNIDITGVSFNVAIAQKYRHLIHQNTQFIAASNFDISLGLEGLRFETATPEKWLQGGIRVINKGNPQGNALPSYPLYKDLSAAETGVTEQDLQTTITLTAKTLPSINKGSLVLYHQYEVGKILDIRPTKQYFEIDVFIYPKHRHLLTEKSLFWVESAAQIDITPKGIRIQATPVARSLKGAISFDNSGLGNTKTLYANELKAKSAGQLITLNAEDATNLTKGMSLRYLGLTIGEIDKIELDNKSNRIIAQALINPNYMHKIAKEGSQFKIISPQISAGGIENLDSLLEPYIDVEIGNGKTKTQFNLAQLSSSRTKYSNGVSFLLETNDAMNLTEGSPVLYRGVEVGTIRKLDLNTLGDRVLIYITIDSKHRHLVRKNSEFWIASGYDFNLGWRGAEFNTGTVQQLLKGGISFSTPSGKVIQPPATSNQRFLLQIKKPTDSPNWNNGALSTK
ncbi:PqiB family protein [Rodentibacter caecimuris]|uniref:Mce/MlaD domain-containing protein n=1 Tax=Rodentibacter caecimuris TaxID=1796644 RepID=A0ABX3KXM6_9PAST|nr:hypothetical protein BKG89_08320 [Rodentibacter heylii]